MISVDQPATETCEIVLAPEGRRLVGLGALELFERRYDEPQVSCQIS